MFVTFPCIVVVLPPPPPTEVPPKQDLQVVILVYILYITGKLGPVNHVSFSTSDSELIMVLRERVDHEGYGSEEIYHQIIVHE